MSVNSKMTAIADDIRSILGISGVMGLDAMKTNLDTVQNDLIGAFTAVSDKGGTIPASKVSGNLASAIASIVTGGGSGGGSGGGGGLPSGVSALTFGTFTPTSDCTSDWPIYHDLGQTPNFFLFYAKDVYTIPEFAGGCFTQFAIPLRFNPNSAMYVISFVNSSGTSYQSMGTPNELMTSLSSNLFVVDAASNRKLLAGVTYNWICGIIDMED